MTFNVWRKLATTTICYNDRVMCATEVSMLESRVIGTTEGRVLIGYWQKRSRLVNKPQRELMRSSEGMSFARSYLLEEAYVLDSPLEEGESVKVICTSDGKGKGFTGCARRYGFKLQNRSRCGQSRRRPGSNGGMKGRLKLGRRMPGRMGNRTVTRSVSLIALNGRHYLIGTVAGTVGTVVKLRRF